MKNFLKIFVFSICVIFQSFSMEISIIRDPEIEDMLTDMAKGIFKVAKINPKNVHVYIIDSSDINAFTIGDGYIFITSGLLLKYNNPLHVLAIMCHEVGHIAAGHVDRQIALMHNSSKNFGIATIASIIGGALTGSPEAGALLLGYAMTDAGFYLRFSRAEEFAADALAVSYLEKLNYGSDLLIESFQVFKRMDLLNGMSNLPVYISTHPKTEDRIRVIEKNKKHKRFKNQKLSKQYQDVIAKLKVYTSNDIPNNPFANIIYTYKIGKQKEAIDKLKKLSVKNNSFYYKITLAEMLHETGNFQDAINIYQKLYSEKINSLIKIDYASTLLDQANKIGISNKKSKHNINNALKILSKMQYDLQINSDVFRLLGKAYGMLQNEGLSAYFIAREQILLQNYAVALKLLHKALKLLPKESSHYKSTKYLISLLKRPQN